jgi:hypothetical protein
MSPGGIWGSKYQPLGRFLTCRLSCPDYLPSHCSEVPWTWPQLYVTWWPGRCLHSSRSQYPRANSLRKLWNQVGNYYVWQRQGVRRGFTHVDFGHVTKCYTYKSSDFLTPNICDLQHRNQSNLTQMSMNDHIRLISKDIFWRFKAQIGGGQLLRREAAQSCQKWGETWGPSRPSFAIMGLSFQLSAEIWMALYRYFDSLLYGKSPLFNRQVIKSSN